MHALIEFIEGVGYCLDNAEQSFATLQALLDEHELNYRAPPPYAAKPRAVSPSRAPPHALAHSQQPHAQAQSQSQPQALSRSSSSAASPASSAPIPIATTASRTSATSAAARPQQAQPQQQQLSPPHSPKGRDRPSSPTGGVASPVLMRSAVYSGEFSGSGVQSCIVVRCTWRDLSKKTIVTKGVLVDPSDTVETISSLLIEKFEIALERGLVPRLYVPAPINSWLQASAQLSSYKFIKDKCEIELKLERLASAGGGSSSSSGSGGGAVAPATIDLKLGAPMILKVYMYKNDKVGGEAVIRKMMFTASDLVEKCVEQVIERFQPGPAPAETPYALYSPLPFNVWLEPYERLAHYHFLNNHMNVQLRMKDSELMLKVTWHHGEIARNLRLPPNTLVSEIIARLVKRNAVDNPDQWVLTAKEAEKTQRYVLPPKAQIGQFATLNMQDLIFKPRAATDVIHPLGAASQQQAQQLSRQSSVALEPKPTTCLGVDPALLDHVDDDGTMVPVCLSKCKEAFIECFGLQTPHAFVDRGSPSAAESVLRDFDADRPLVDHGPLALAAAILLWYERLPTKIFQSLEAKLEKAATNYEASLLLAAQLPQRHGLLLAWLMDLLVQVTMSSTINGTTVEMLGAQLSPVLCNGNQIVAEKLAKIAAMILQDKVDERIEREEMLAAAAFQSQMRHQQQQSSFDDDAPPQYQYQQQQQYQQQSGAADVHSWTKEDVSEWVASVDGGGSDIADRMLDEEIDGECLLALERSDLARFGVTTLGPQKKLLAAIAALTQ